MKEHTHVLAHMLFWHCTLADTCNVSVQLHMHSWSTLYSVFFEHIKKAMPTDVDTVL